MAVHFVVPGGWYQHAVVALVNPTLRWLSKATVGDSPKEGALNVVFFTEKEAVHPSVLMSHGVADKNYITGMSPSVAEKFDYLLVAGEGYREKISAELFKPENVFVVGWPKIDYIVEGKFGTAKRDRVRKHVLWAPTHNAIQSVSTYPVFEKYLGRFPTDKYIVTSSVHPARKKDGQTTIKDLINAEVVIADSGSMIYEAWMMGKPVIFPDWLVKAGVVKKFSGSFEAEIYEQQIGYHAKNFSQILALLETDLTVEPSVQSFLQKVVEKKHYGNSGWTIANILKDLDKKHFG